MCRKTLTFSIDDLKEDKKKSAVQLSLEACYLYIPVPFQSAHHIVVEITVVPFCLPSYPGQTFYYASPSYARCCSSAQKHEFLPKLIDVACKLYQLNVHCHSWNFDVPQSWYVHWSCVYSSSHRNVCRESHDDILRNASCLQRSVRHLEYLTGRMNKPHTINPLLTRASPEPTMCYGMSPEIASAQIPSTSTSIGVYSAARSEENGDNGDVFLCPQPASADSITSSLHVADEFLKALEEVDTSQINSRYCSPFVQLHLPAHDENENRAARAWRLCTMAARWAQRHLENAKYTRFISLCFFLVWESLSCKAGKAGAREINVRMRQAGFEGTSRSFKSLRDETVLINQLIASVEHVHGTEAASVIMWHIFGGSNYQMIRTINRFSKAKKHFAVAYISRKATFPSFLQLPILNRRVQDIIAEQLADLQYRPVISSVSFLY
ncbi:hypothetical protein B0J12DRAFT_587220 [Macrophomina phaseolina]|uniref:Uncharacterized protein n=1 Tax=Macrophomina phaseolina TaxID=35725 RepID=A0ABQ8FPZ9_9PEZI|nr:hypothetical protein B0J12DRAFT_587220 [Macrophomina phaseolina]